MRTVAFEELAVGALFKNVYGGCPIGPAWRKVSETEADNGRYGEFHVRTGMHGVTHLVEVDHLGRVLPDDPMGHHHGRNE